MINFITSIVDTIVSLGKFIIHTIESLTNLLLNIPQYTLFLTNSLLNVPTVLIPFMSASIGIYVMFLITDRNINN